MQSESYSIKHRYGLFNLLILIQSLMFIFLFPNLEYPDSGFHIAKVFYGSDYSNEIYFNIVNYFKNLIENIFSTQLTLMYTSTGIREFLSMSNIVKYDGGNFSSLYPFQILNIVIVFIFIFAFNIFVNRDYKVQNDIKHLIKKVNYLYFLYPQTAYFITTLTPDFFNFLVQPLFVYLVYTRRYIEALLIVIILFKFFDQGIITNLFILIVYFFIVNLRFLNTNKKKLLFIFVVSVSTILLFLFSRTIFINLYGFNDYADLSIHLIRNYGVFYTKIINFLLSSFCFWGIGNFITIPLFYILYFLIVVAIFSKSIFRNRVIDHLYFELFVSLLITVIFFLIFFGTHSNIRFFMFYIVILLIGYEIYYKEFPWMIHFSEYKIALIFFFHNLFLILFYAVKIFVLGV